VAGPAGTPETAEVAAGDGAPGFEVAAAGLPLSGLGSPCPPLQALVETTNTAVETTLPVRTVASGEWLDAWHTLVLLRAAHWSRRDALF
jgi:hypothetical protein